jgi:hypothetical protein
MTIIHTHTHTKWFMPYYVFYDFTVGFWLHHILLSWSSVTFTSSIHACTCVLWSRRLHFSCSSCSSRLNREGYMDITGVSTWQCLVLIYLRSSDILLHYFLSSARNKAYKITNLPLWICVLSLSALEPADQFFTFNIIMLKVKSEGSW